MPTGGENNLRHKPEPQRGRPKAWKNVQGAPDRSHSDSHAWRDGSDAAVTSWILLPTESHRVSQPTCSTTQKTGRDRTQLPHQLHKQHLKNRDECCSESNRTANVSPCEWIILCTGTECTLLVWRAKPACSGTECCFILACHESIYSAKRPTSWYFLVL